MTASNRWPISYRRKVSRAISWISGSGNFWPGIRKLPDRAQTVANVLRRQESLNKRMAQRADTVKVRSRTWQAA